jgi:hypothetical protein
LASETATFASPPPNVAVNWVLCEKRKYPGVAKRNIISPKVITLFLIVSFFE